MRKKLIALAQYLFITILEESLVMAGLLNSYSVYNTNTGEYTAVTTFTDRIIGQPIQAPWFSAHAGDQVIVLERSTMYILTT